MNPNHLSEVAAAVIVMKPPLPMLELSSRGNCCRYCAIYHRDKIDVMKVAAALAISCPRLRNLQRSSNTRSSVDSFRQKCTFRQERVKGKYKIKWLQTNVPLANKKVKGALTSSKVVLPVEPAITYSLWVICWKKEKPSKQAKRTLMRSGQKLWRSINLAHIVHARVATVKQQSASTLGCRVGKWQRNALVEQVSFVH